MIFSWGIVNCLAESRRSLNCFALNLERKPRFIFKKLKIESALIWFRSARKYSNKPFLHPPITIHFFSGCLCIKSEVIALFQFIRSHLAINVDYRTTINALTFLFSRKWVDKKTTNHRLTRTNRNDQDHCKYRSPVARYDQWMDHLPICHDTRNMRWDNCFGRPFQLNFSKKRRAFLSAKATKKPFFQLVCFSLGDRRCGRQRSEGEGDVGERNPHKMPFMPLFFVPSLSPDSTDIIISIFE